MRSLFLIATLALAACGSGGAQPRPNEQRSFAVAGFDEIQLMGSHDVVVTTGAQPSVRAQGDGRTLDRMEIDVDGHTLRIRERSHHGWFSFHHGDGVTVYVTVPALQAATVAGSGSLRVNEVRGPSFTGTIAGSGDLQVAMMQARSARFSIAGTGGIEASGTADQAEVSIAGSGDAALDRLQARNARVSIAGSGQVHLRATDTVEGRIMGSGDLRVEGGARCSVTRAGSGNVVCG